MFGDYAIADWFRHLQNILFAPSRVGNVFEERPPRGATLKCFTAFATLCDRHIRLLQRLDTYIGSSGGARRYVQGAVA